MKSPIPWIGGKSQLKSKIIKSFPPTESYNRFIDVFGGGGSILFAKGKHADLEIYNDANSDLVNFFRCLKYHSDELKKEIKYYLNSLENPEEAGRWIAWKCSLTAVSAYL